MSPIEQLFKMIYDFLYSIFAKLGAGMVGKVE